MHSKELFCGQSGLVDCATSDVFAVTIGHNGLSSRFVGVLEHLMAAFGADVHEA